MVKLSNGMCRLNRLNIGWELNNGRTNETEVLESYCNFGMLLSRRIDIRLEAWCSAQGGGSWAHLSYVGQTNWGCSIQFWALCFKINMINRHICLKWLRNIDKKKMFVYLCLHMHVHVSCYLVSNEGGAWERGWKSVVWVQEVRLELKFRLFRCSEEPFTSSSWKQLLLPDAHYLIILLTFLYKL